MQQEASKRTELAIDADAGLECMKQTLEIAEAAGRFVQASRAPPHSRTATDCRRLGHTVCAAPTVVSYIAALPRRIL